MNYDQGVRYMINLVKQSDKGSFNPIPSITINYPGYKKTGDYRLTFNGKNAPTHADICEKLYNLIQNGNFSFITLKNFLSDVYENGTDTHYTNNSLEELKHLIYWITLQEEINYPRRSNFAGINLAFCRFFESIYATQPGSNITLQDVRNRCNNHGSNRPNLYDINNAPDFYHY